MVKRTLQEIANFFDMAVTVDGDGSVWMHRTMPTLSDHRWHSKGGYIFIVDRYTVDNSDDRRESLTLPDSWPKKPKFKEGEIVVSKHYFDVRPWSPATMDESRYRRPTKAEWKVLKGEE